MSSAPLSRSAEDYLKAVYELNSRGGAAGTGDLARALDVQPASVTGMIRRLALEGLVDHVPYRGVRLTERGARIALQVLRRHRILETFLVCRLGYAWDDVHDEAERMEHAVSDTLVERMATVLGHPVTDPHGAPIPSRGGRIDPTPWCTLAEVPAGRCARVRSVSDEDPDQLRYFQSVGLVPDAQIEVRRTGQAHEASERVSVMVEGRGEIVALAPGVARGITVWKSAGAP